jgi:hypothetical protein
MELEQADIEAAEATSSYAFDKFEVSRRPPLNRRVKALKEKKALLAEAKLKHLNETIKKHGQTFMCNTDPSDDGRQSLAGLTRDRQDSVWGHDFWSNENQKRNGSVSWLTNKTDETTSSNGGKPNYTNFSLFSKVKCHSNYLYRAHCAKEQQLQNFRCRFLALGTKRTFPHSL